MNKNFTILKTTVGELLGIFQHPICRKLSNKIEGQTLWRKKSHNAEKN